MTGGKDFDYEFRTTVVKEFHEAFDFLAIGQMIEGANRYFLQCFTDRDSVPFGNLHAPTADELDALLLQLREHMTLKDATREASEALKLPKKQVYARALELKSE